ncbi:MAG TPA: hypothetical protein VL137_14315 [Polyangiaceae bacterium]|nr:hypothetical protein [Polyangiaceae bacterium]
MIRSPKFRKETGVLTPEQRQTVEKLFTANNVEAFLFDGLKGTDRLFTPTRPVLHNALWIVPGQPAAGACWADDNLSPETQHLIATMTQLIATLCGPDVAAGRRSSSAN